jgi:thiamine-phosphate diphosphorylase
MDRRALNLDVYVLTSLLWPDRTHRDVAIAAIEGGATAVQLRAPELESEPAVEVRLAAELAARCCQVGVLFIVNNVVDVAIESGADGVHLGQEDEQAGVRARLGPDRVLGVSVEDPDQARAAEEAGADYLAATVWSTPTKQEARPVGLEGLHAIADATRLPVVGIGGVDATNAERVLAAGAAGIAVVSAVGAAPDPVRATRELMVVVRAAKAGRSAR